jgi:membrane protease YdiL (CAAX protease family)
MEDPNAINYKTKVTAGILIAFFLIPIFGHFVFAGQGYTAQRILISRCLFWIEIILLIIYVKFVEKSKFLLWPEKKQKFWFYPASFGALYLLAITASAVAAIPKLFGIPDNREVMEQMLHILNKSMPLMIFSAITAGVTEELIFRGYMVPRMEVIFKNKYLPVIVSALMFSALHFKYLSIHELLFTFFFGVVFAIHYQWYRNVTILIITHAVIDFISFLIFGFLEAYNISHHIIRH